MAKGYSLPSGDPKPFEIDTTQPDGALSASGGDMGRFMIAHLQNGAFGASRILEEATAVRMHTTAWEFLPPLNRMLLGFYENNLNGHRVITHGGDLQWFHNPEKTPPELPYRPNADYQLFLIINRDHLV